jgi:quercetin dioxygenase-like cupin family protein
VTRLGEVDPVELPGGSWSRMVAKGERSSLGTSVFAPGTVLQPVRHETEEVAYVVSGAGELRLDDGAVPFHEGDALHIPPGLWHAVANTGEENVVMVFGFPHPDYPPTERR